MDNLTTEALINLDWLWEHMEFRMPTRLGNVMMTRDKGPFYVLTCLELYVDGETGRAFDILMLGAGHNQGAQKTLEKYYDSHGEFAFWDLVVKAAKNFRDKDIEPGAFQTNIKWQRINTWETLKAAKRHFEEDQPSNPIAGMYALMSGQKHNVGVMKQYRYFYRYHQDLLLQMVHIYGQDDAPMPHI